VNAAGRALLGDALLDIASEWRESVPMPAEQRRAEHPLPNKATGLSGLQDLFFGRREYAHPALRWAARPLRCQI